MEELQKRLDTGRGVRLTLGGALAVVVLGATSCAVSPETTVVESSGEERTVHWEGYPGNAYTEDRDILDVPTPEEVEDRQRQLFAELEEVLRDGFEVELSPRGESGWHAAPGNGYGGESYLTTYSSAAWTSKTAPEGPHAWRELLDAVDETFAAHELGGLVLLHESSLYAADAEWQEDLFERFGTRDPEEYWEWTAQSLNGSQWVSVTITDAGKDPSGEAGESLREMEWPEQSVRIEHGVTTVSTDRREDFQRAMEPFEGLAKPAGTHSD